MDGLSLARVFPGGWLCEEGSCLHELYPSKRSRAKTTYSWQELYKSLVRDVFVNGEYCCSSAAGAPVFSVEQAAARLCGRGEAWGYLAVHRRSGRNPLA